MSKEDKESAKVMGTIWLFSVGFLIVLPMFMRLF